MPRNLDFQKELREIRQLIDNDSSEPRTYTVRLSPAIALYLLRDCLDQGKQPSRMLTELVSNYYSVWQNGVHMELSTSMRADIDAIANAFDVDRETVAKLLIGKALSTGLREAREEIKRRQVEREKLAATKEPKRTRSSE